MHKSVELLFQIHASIRRLPCRLSSLQDFVKNVLISGSLASSEAG